MSRAPELQGYSKNSAAGIPIKVGTDASVSLGIDASVDASLFSSSMPVLPHKKLTVTSVLDHPFTDDSFPRLSNWDQGTKDKDPVEDVADGALRSLLPDDEDDLLAGIMDDFDLAGLPSQPGDLEEYDIFGSGGVMELDPDPIESFSVSMSKVSISDGIAANGVGHYALSGGTGTVAGEHPYGEHPSRTLFVRNINSNVEDTELRSLFEQYGDIRTLYTACKHRGFVMISYYDIRAARTAMRALQNKPLRRRKLDIHFSIPKDNPSEKDINQGTLVVFNLDASVSNDELHQLFGDYGEIKEIRETPHKRHHKFVEYYDVRDAEAAIRALNRIEIAGKRIKLEPSRPGGARRNLMQQLNLEMEHDEIQPFRQQPASAVANSPPGSWAPIDDTFEQSSLQALSRSPLMGSPNLTKAKPLPGLASLLLPHVPDSRNFAAFAGNQRRNNHSKQTYAHTGSPQGPTYLHYHSLPERNLGTGPSLNFPRGEINVNASGVGAPSVQQFFWGGPAAYTGCPTSSVRSISSVRNPFGLTSRGQAQSYANHIGSLFGLHQPHHVGSAPTRIPLDRYFTGPPKSSYMSLTATERTNSGLYDGNYGTNRGLRATMSSSLHIPGNMSENGSGTSTIRLPTQDPGFLINGSRPGLGRIGIEGLFEQMQSQCVVMSGNPIDRKKQYQRDDQEHF